MTDPRNMRAAAGVARRGWTVSLAAAAVVIFGAAMAAERAPWMGSKGSAVSVDTTPELLAALRSARPGDTILLTPGRYEDVEIRSLRFESPVTIASADPRRPAVLRDLTVAGSSGLTFRGMDFSTVGAQGPAEPGGVDVENKGVFKIHINGSHYITFSHMHFYGDPNGTLKTDISGMLIKRSDHITISNNEFQHFIHTIAHLGVDNLVVTHNEFHDIWDDGVRGGGSSNVLIQGNRFTTFHMELSDQDHPDCIQFWTKHFSVRAHDITIVDNVFVRGRGLPIHGVFMRDDNLDLPFDKVSIRHNLVVGAGFRGISVIGATNVEVVDNVVAPFNDRRSYISLENVRGATVKHNRSGLFKYKTSSDIVENDNQVQAVVTDGGVGLVRAWETGLGPDDRAGMTRTGEALPVRPSSAPRA